MEVCIISYMRGYMPLFSPRWLIQRKALKIITQFLFLETNYNQTECWNESKRKNGIGMGGNWHNSHSNRVNLKPSKNYSTNYSKTNSKLFKYKWIQKEVDEFYDKLLLYILQTESAVTYSYCRHRSCLLRQPFRLSSLSSPEELLHPLTQNTQTPSN